MTFYFFNLKAEFKTFKYLGFGIGWGLFDDREESHIIFYLPGVGIKIGLDS